MHLACANLLGHHLAGAEQEVREPVLVGDELSRLAEIDPVAQTDELVVELVHQAIRHAALDVAGEGWAATLELGATAHIQEVRLEALLVVLGGAADLCLVRLPLVQKLRHEPVRHVVKLASMRVDASSARREVAPEISRNIAFSRVLTRTSIVVCARNLSTSALYPTPNLANGSTGFARTPPRVADVDTSDVTPSTDQHVARHLQSLRARPAATTAPAGKRAPTRRAPVVINPKPSSNSRCVARLPRGAVVARGRKGMLAELMDDGVDGPAETPADTTCPCGSGGEYDACCGALHSGAGSDDAEPEAIVRAFLRHAKNIPAYIVSSTHPDSKDLKRKDDPKEALEQLEKDAAATMKQVSFKSIRKMKASPGARRMRRSCRTRWRTRGGEEEQEWGEDARRAIEV